MKVCVALLLSLTAAMGTPVNYKPSSDEKAQTFVKKGSGCGHALSSFTNDEKDNFVAEHNRMRTAEKAGLKALQWDDELARRAQELADTCVFHHALTTKCDGDTSIGQNLYAAAAKSATAGDAVSNWFEEKENYDSKKSSCKAGKTCGHYTQVVWKDSQKVGCAIAECGHKIWSNPQFPTNWIVVCNYYPPGNDY